MSSDHKQQQHLSCDVVSRFCTTNKIDPDSVVTIVHISDTHCQDVGHLVPNGDILVHSGDFLNKGSEDVAEMNKFLEWFEKLPHLHKIIVCGNHEYSMDKYSFSELEEMLRCSDRYNQMRRGQGRHYLLNDRSVTIDGVKFYGSPWNGSRGQAWGCSSQERAAKWSAIPANTDVLVTHMPPLGICDLAWTKKAPDYTQSDCPVCGSRHRQYYAHWGCSALAERLTTSSRSIIPLHLFGHVHDDNAIRVVGGTTYSNAAMDMDPRPHVIRYYMRRGEKQQEEEEAGNTTTTLAHQHPQEQNSSNSSMKKVNAEEMEPLVGMKFSLENASGQRRLRLDLDAADKNSRTVIPWKPNGRINQQWTVEACDDKIQRGCRFFVIRSVAAASSSSTGKESYLAVHSSGRLVYAHESEHLPPVQIQQYRGPMPTSFTIPETEYYLGVGTGGGGGVEGDGGVVALVNDGRSLKVVSQQSSGESSQTEQVYSNRFFLKV